MNNMEFNKSEFNGGVLDLIGYKILFYLISFLTLGIGMPWGFCLLYTWEIKNTKINGVALDFLGTGGGLFLQYLKWLLLSIITFGIYSFWAAIEFKKWKAENTIFANN